VAKVWNNTTIIVPGASGNFGIVLTGASYGTSDTDYNVFNGTTILVGGTEYAHQLSSQRWQCI